MKHLIFILLSMNGIHPIYAQNYDNYQLKSEVGGNGNSPSSQTPGSFIVSINQNNTFIRDSLNRIQAVSHGYDETHLTGYNCVITQSENGLTYHVFTPNAGECFIAINGVNTKTKRSVNLGLYRFNVADSVYHDIYLDQVISGRAITGKVTTVFCKNRDYWNGKEDEIEVLTWKITQGGKEVSGTGSEISKEGVQFIQTVPPGEAIMVTVQAKSNFQKTFVTKGVFLKS